MNKSNEQNQRDTGLFPIGTVANLTGVNPVTLRAWERRYGLLKPKRTGKGHRFYTQADIDLLHRVVTLLEKGVPIGQIAPALALSDSDLEPRGETRAVGPWERYQARMLVGVTRFNESALEETYRDALSLYPIDVVNRQLLLPFLQTLGNRWASGEGSVAEEHFFGVYLRNKLGARFSHRSLTNTGPRLLAACLPKEQHEVGLLLFALSAHDRGFQLVLLGANMPLAELPPAVKRSRSDAVVLSGSACPGPQLLNQDLPALVAELTVPVFIGGVASESGHEEIIRAGAIPVGVDIQAGLRRIDKHFDGDRHG